MDAYIKPKARRLHAWLRGMAFAIRRRRAGLDLGARNQVRSAKLPRIADIVARTGREPPC
jgi:hypothetical protein